MCGESSGSARDDRSWVVSAANSNIGHASEIVVGVRIRPRLSAKLRTANTGATLIEVVLFIVILSIALGSILGLLAMAVGRSGDPMVLRQSIAVAESLLQEVMAQPFTTLDLDGGANAIGPEAGETRGSPTAGFDHVDDYHGLTLAGITAPDGTPIAGLQGYSANITVEPVAVGGIAAGDGLLVRVTVTGPDAIPVSVAGYRARLTP